ncbi:MAG: zinc ABC transporter substrate-binding protein [Verrucomicrobiota bacterium]
MTTESTEGDGSFQVVATTGMIADLASEIVGDEAQVTGLIGTGVDPHLYQATSADVKELMAADVILYNGLHLEGKMADILEKLARDGKPVYPVAEALLAQDDYLLPGDDYDHDPHVWMDVAGWMRAARVVADAVADFSPDQAEIFRENSENYLAELAALDQYAKDTIATIPENKRVLVTAHDAFGYLARAYGLTVRGIQGLSTESEAGVRDIENLVTFLVERKIPAVFVETSVSDKNIRALIEGCQAQGHEVVIGGELFSDATGPSGTYEGTYIGMIDHNVTTLTRALGGEAPRNRSKW